MYYSVRGISREIGALAMKRMQERQDRWRAKTADNPKLRYLQHHNVNSAIEMVVNEGLECKCGWFVMQSVANKDYCSKQA